MLQLFICSNIGVCLKDPLFIVGLVSMMLIFVANIFNTPTCFTASYKNHPSCGPNDSETLMTITFDLFIITSEKAQVEITPPWINPKT
jgi:hypothetical protein